MVGLVIHRPIKPIARRQVRHARDSRSRCVYDNESGRRVLSEAGAAINLAAKQCPSSLLQALARIIQADVSTPEDPLGASARGAAETAIRECVPLHPRPRSRASQRFGRGLNYLFNDWIERFGPVKDCDVRIRKRTVKEMRRDARRRYEHDIGAAYALEFLSYHVEASYLPGEDAAFVYDLTSHYISEAGDAARRIASG